MPTERLPVTGGSPVRDTLLPYGRQAVDEDDIAAVTDALRAPWLTTGPRVREFEAAFAQYVGARFAVAVSSGTAALHAATHAAGIGPGDEVITTPFTFCATVNAVLFVGATPVLADVDSETLNIDPEAVRRRITPRTKAILPVDYAGHPADLEAINRIADEHKLTVIEDACHALGATQFGRRIGSISRMTAFSFHPVKHITTAEGGMVVTDDPQLAERLKRFRNHGITTEAADRQASGAWFYEVVELGVNYRVSDVACALGLSQLAKIEGNLRRRREIAAMYRDGLSGCADLMLPVEREGVRSAWHLFPVRIVGHNGPDRDALARALRAENIGTSVHYIPVHLHPYYRRRFGWRPGDYPISEAAYSQILSLPMFHSMSDADVGDVLHGLRKVLKSA